MRIKIAVGAVLTLLVGATIVGVQNTDVVQLQFLFWDTSVSLLRVVLGSVILGFVAGFVAALVTRRKVLS
jgi:uncharacterized integral membrane protein